jgi:hypothetical protein
LNRRLLEGYGHFKDEPRVQKLREDVLKYNRLVRDLGLRDHQVTLYNAHVVLLVDESPGSQSAKSELENFRLARL